MPATAKIFCVAKDETDVIESWIVYHASLVGLENLVVIDNLSSCDKVLGVYDKYRKKGLTVDKCFSFAGSGQGEAFTASMRAHQKSCMFLFGLDADEFLTFPNFLSGAPRGGLQARLRTYLLGLPRETTKFGVRAYFEAVPDPSSEHYVDQKVENPVQNITTFRHETPRPGKVFFRADAFVSTVNGCHDGRVSRGKAQQSDVCLVHYHSTGARRSIERARAIVSAYRYADVDAPLHTQLRQLQVVRSPFGSHRVLEYGLFLSRVLTLNSLVHKRLWPKSSAVLRSKERKFHTINDVAVDTSGCCKIPQDWQARFDELVFYDGEAKHAVRTRPLLGPLPIQSTPSIRVALMLSGHFRNFAKRRSFWNAFVKEHRVDIFVHAWSESGVRADSSWIDIDKGRIDEDDIKKTLRPVSMRVENHAEMVDSFSLQQDGLDLFYAEFPGLRKARDFSKHVMSQLYSIYQAFKLVDSHEQATGIKYDFLIRLRADSIIENFSRVFTTNLGFVKDNVLLVNGTSVHQHPGGGRGCRACDQQFASGERKHKEHANDVCDVFYWGRFPAMRRACELFLHARDLVRSFKFHNARAVTEPGVKRALINHGNVIGVVGGQTYEKKIKCFYPERLLREHMADHWIVSDPLRMTPRIMY